jgi:hypothetical protein
MKSRIRRQEKRSVLHIPGNNISVPITAVIAGWLTTSLGQGFNGIVGNLNR